MKIERWLPLILLPNIAIAGGGGGAIIGVVIFLPVLIWAFIKIWKFWFSLIFGGNSVRPSQEQSPQPSIQHPQVNQENNQVKECPFCAEIVLIKAIKCKHCGSAL